MALMTGKGEKGEGLINEGLQCIGSSESSDYSSSTVSVVCTVCNSCCFVAVLCKLRECCYTLHTVLIKRECEGLGHQGRAS
jgi:hypothetical protein